MSSSPGSGRCGASNTRNRRPARPAARAETAHAVVGVRAACVNVKEQIGGDEQHRRDAGSPRRPGSRSAGPGRQAQASVQARVRRRALAMTAGRTERRATIRAAIELRWGRGPLSSALGLPGCAAAVRDEHARSVFFSSSVRPSYSRHLQLDRLALLRRHRFQLLVAFSHLGVLLGSHAGPLLHARLRAAAAPAASSWGNASAISTHLIRRLPSSLGQSSASGARMLLLLRQ